MTRKKLVIALGCLSLVLLLGGAAAGALFWRQKSLPVYVMGELPPSQGYGTNTLTLGDVTYVSGKAEFRLLPQHPPFRPAWPIGRTSRELQVFRPDGQAGQDYVYTNGFMMTETVYRDSRLAPLEVADLRVREMRFPPKRGSTSSRTNRDEQLIHEVLASLAAPPSVVLHPNYDAGDQGYRLDLMPEQTPGLAYTIDTLIDNTGRVYFSTDPELSQDTWIPAGPLFTRWVHQ